MDGLEVLEATECIKPLSVEFFVKLIGPTKIQNSVDLNLISSNLRFLRTRLGFYQKSLAEKIGTARSYINRLENGKIEPTLSTLVRLANAFDLPLILFIDLLFSDSHKDLYSKLFKSVDSKKIRRMRGYHDNDH